MIRMAILGAGSIARAMAKTVNGMDTAKVVMYGVASRDKAKAQAFADEWRIPHAYGSYDEMLSDPAIDLVYVATPHSHHAGHVKLCLEHGKHVLCEKAFTVNAKQAEAVCALAKEKGLLLAEAIWTRYMPSRKILDDLLASGIIGEPRVLTANLSYPIDQVPRIRQPELAGGALLDVGVYTLNFASMVFGDGEERMESSVCKLDTGVDLQESITLHYPDGRMAVLTASAAAVGDRRGIIQGTKGYVTVENINNPESITVCIRTQDGNKKETVDIPPCITGYEYEVEACIEAIEKGWLECPAMPHAETVCIMKKMDALRAQWGLTYPCE